MDLLAILLGLIVCGMYFVDATTYLNEFASVACLCIFLGSLPATGAIVQMVLELLSDIKPL